MSENIFEKVSSDRDYLFLRLISKDFAIIASNIDQIKFKIAILTAVSFLEYLESRFVFKCDHRLAS